MIFLRKFLVLLVISVAAIAAGPIRVHADSAAMMLAVDPEPVVAITPAGERRFSVEIADDAAEQSAGLMFRLSLADDHGMLFVFRDTRPASFWMKNTPLPLDLVFIGENGKVVAILPGKPFSLSMISPGMPVRFVLEVKSGIAARNGIVPGTVMRHPVIDRVSGVH